MNVELVYPNDALDNGLSYTKMIKEMDQRHPRIYENKEYKEYPICRTKTGGHLCCKMFRKSDLDEIGIGISLYFKMLKSLMVLFVIATILSIPAYVYFSAG